MNQAQRAGAPRSARGVTLVELMVVMVVVAILASVAVASYREYTLRAGRSEAKVALMQAQNNLERCFTRFSTYDVASPPAGAGDTCVALTAALAGGQPTEGGRYAVTATTLTATTYTLQAVPLAGGGMADDAKCSMLGVNQAGQRTHAGSATREICWR